jgi:hypothetical protein
LSKRKRKADVSNSALPKSWLILALPTEVLVLIFKLLNSRDLRAMTQVSRHLLEVVCPLYMAALGLDYSCKGALNVSCAAYSALSVWRRSTHYRPLATLFCWFSVIPSEAVWEVIQVENFFLTHPSIQSVEFGTASIGNSAVFARLLRSIQFTDCRELRFGCFGSLFSAMMTRRYPRSLTPSTFSLDQLELFHANACFLFSTSFIDFTINTILSSPIKDLSLTETELTSQQWAKLLWRLNVPTLQSLFIDGEVPVVTLSKFLSRHSDLRKLYILPCLRSSFRSYRSRLQLPKLEILFGPAAFVDVFLSSFDLPSTLQHLSITSKALKGDNYIATVGRILRSATTCERLSHLSMEIPGDVMGYSALVLGGGEMLLNRIERLSIACLVPTAVGDFAVCPMLSEMCFSQIS